jgi:hypothetical protein
LYAINLSQDLDRIDPLTGKYFIDFTSVRGGYIINELKDKITYWHRNEPTCDLFTGDVGCGKSMELLRLKEELQEEGFEVVYFQSSEDLELSDVDICDVLLAITRRVSQNLSHLTLGEPKKFKGLLQGMVDVLTAEVTGVQFIIPGLGKLGVNTADGHFSLSVGIGEIMVKTRREVKLRDEMHKFLDSQKSYLVKVINEELLEPAIAKLKENGKQGLVVIVDNLDRLDSRINAFGRPQQEYLFVDQAEYLTSLRCHMIYTMPLSLKFSNEYGNLTQRYPDEPKVLPMVPVQLRNGADCPEGIALMKQMILARAFPDETPEERLEYIPDLFDSEESLTYLCRMSGGNVRNISRLLIDWVKKERAFPLTRSKLDMVINARRNEMTIPISADEWALLRWVQANKKVSGDDGYEILIRSRLVFEYRYGGEQWFDINPILLGSPQLNHE